MARRREERAMPRRRVLLVGADAAVPGIRIRTLCRRRQLRLGTELAASDTGCGATLLEWSGR